LLAGVICLLAIPAIVQLPGETTTTWESARTEISSNQYPKTTMTWGKPVSYETYTIFNKETGETIEVGERWQTR